MWTMRRASLRLALFMRTSRMLAALAIALGIAPLARAESPAPAVQFNVPDDSPILLQSFDVSAVPERPRGTPIVREFDTRLRVRNASSKTIVGVAVSVAYEGISAVPAASVVTTGIRVAPQAEFPLHIALETAHATRVSISSPGTVQILLDCVLFSDLSTYGPNHLRERMNLLVYELQARRERGYISQLLKAGRLPDIREELNFGLPAEAPAWALKVATQRNMGRGELLHVQALLESGPIQIVRGTIEAAGGRFWSPLFEVRAQNRAVPASLDIALILADERGREAIAAILPFSIEADASGTIRLQSAITAQASALDSVPVLIRKCHAFVSDVRFADGSVWIPSRADLEKASAASLPNDAPLLNALSTCPERQRLAAVFRRGGMQAVESDLKRFE